MEKRRKRRLLEAALLILDRVMGTAVDALKLLNDWIAWRRHGN